MQTIPDATGQVPLFESEGGPGQKKWYNVRVAFQQSGVNVDVYSAGNLAFTVASNGSARVQGSADLLLVTGEDVYLYLGSGVADVDWSVNVCTEEN